MPADFILADGAVKAFNAGCAPGAVTASATFTVTVEVNVTAYAAEHGDRPEDETDDAVGHVRDMILECVPSHLRGAVLVAVREDSRTYPSVTPGTGATS